MSVDQTAQDTSTAGRTSIDAIGLHSFIGAEAGPKEQSGFYRSLGRGYKLDRQEIIGLLVAFDEWMEMDHDRERFEPAWEKVKVHRKGHQGFAWSQEYPDDVLPQERERHRIPYYRTKG